MRTVLLLAFFVTFTLAYDPVFVDELEDLVFNRQDKMELEMLDDDDYMIRFEKKKRLDEILARQPESVKKLYEMKVEIEKLRHKRKMQERIDRATDPEIEKYWMTVEEIANDMTISEKEASMRKKALKSSLRLSHIWSYDD